MSPGTFARTHLLSHTKPWFRSCRAEERRWRLHCPAAFGAQTGAGHAELKLPWRAEGFQMPSRGLGPGAPCVPPRPGPGRTPPSLALTAQLGTAGHCDSEIGEGKAGLCGGSQGMCTAPVNSSDQCQNNLILKRQVGSRCAPLRSTVART